MVSHHGHNPPRSCLNTHIKSVCRLSSLPGLVDKSEGFTRYNHNGKFGIKGNFPFSVIASAHLHRFPASAVLGKCCGFSFPACPLCPEQGLCSSSSSLMQNSLCLSLLQFLPLCSSQCPTQEEIQSLQKPSQTQNFCPPMAITHRFLFYIFLQL